LFPSFFFFLVVIIAVKEIQSMRQSLGLTDAKRFYLFGSPIGKSLSPLLHNTGFEYCSLPYEYSRCETTDSEVVKKTINQPEFGGSFVRLLGLFSLSQDLAHLFSVLCLVGP
jgi:hypothetical protein